MATSWPENNPETLEDLCLKVAAKNIDAYADKSIDGYTLKEGISLQHPSLCDKLFQVPNRFNMAEHFQRHIFDKIKQS